MLLYLLSSTTAPTPPLISTGDTFSDPNWMSKTIEIYYVLSIYTYA